MLNASQIQALNLINHGNGGGLTHYANVLVSRAAQSLLELKLIDYAPNLRNVGYKLTKAGYAALKEVNPNYTRYVDYINGCYADGEPLKKQ